MKEGDSPPAEAAPARGSGRGRAPEDASEKAQRARSANQSRGVSLPRADEEKRLLKARARALARVPEKEADSSRQLAIIEFTLAQERYAVEVRYVREVYPLKDLTPLPCTPQFVLGIINVRGQIFSVVDIRKLFDLPEKGLADLHKVLLLDDGTMEFGILAEAVPGLRWLDQGNIQPSLPTLTGIREEYLKGIAEGPLVILDAGALLADPKLVVNEAEPR